MIRNAHKQDVTTIGEIYNHYISETVATFETDIITPKDILKRLSKIQSDGLPWLVAENSAGEVIGYAYASKWRERFAYRFTVEITVYLSPEFSGNGIGTELYKALFSQLKLQSIHTVIGGITLPNQASIALHEKLGLKKVAHFKDVGFKFNQWLDVGYWQGTLS